MKAPGLPAYHVLVMINSTGSTRGIEQLLDRGRRSILFGVVFIDTN